MTVHLDGEEVSGVFLKKKSISKFLDQISTQTKIANEPPVKKAFLEDIEKQQDKQIVQKKEKKVPSIHKENEENQHTAPSPLKEIDKVENQTEKEEINLITTDSKFIRKDLKLTTPEELKDLEKILPEKVEEIKEEFKETYNANIIETNLKKYEEYFDTVESCPLTEKQREACVSDEVNTLVLAGAGSGKTSVMIGRIGYLIKSGLAKPKEILVLAFNTAAAKELKERVNKKLASIQGVKDCHISTFHSLGNTIFTQINGSEFKVADYSDDKKKLNLIVDEIINKYLESDSEFIASFLELYNSTYLPEPPSEEINSKEEYSKYISKIEPRTLKGELVKGFGELQIANYLYLNGIEYLYEPNYTQITKIQTEKPYHPDFYIPEIDTFLEHFGIDREGNTRKDISKEKYTQEMDIKRQIHKTNNTKLIETYHYDFSEGNLTQKLEEILKDNGATFKETNKKDIFEKINKLKKRSKIGEEITKSINLIRSSDLNEEQIMDKLKNEYGTYQSKRALNILTTIIGELKKSLKERKEYTYAEMINESVKFVKNGQYKPEWKYILVDEFQDISEQRTKLIKALRENSENCSLFCVGDDWQAINGFAGSELKFTTDFQELIGEAEVITLDKTFRFNNKICDFATKFITKNPKQYKKDITTLSQTEEPSIAIRSVSDDKYQEEIIKIVSEIPPNKSVMILKRNKHGSEVRLSKIKKDTGNNNVTLTNIHKSKGLEADYVIISHVIHDKAGIPSLISTSKIIKPFIAIDDSYHEAEERRLFYVAITRAKEKCFILTEFDRPSIFVNEILEDEYEVDFGNTNKKLFYIPEKCSKCSAQLSKKTSKAGNVYYECSRTMFCGEKFYSCTKCQNPLLEKNYVFGCTNQKCEYSHQYGNSKNDCRACHKSVVLPYTTKKGERKERCINPKCPNPNQYKCAFCNTVKDNFKKCQNMTCFAFNYKCQKCDRPTRKVNGKYGLFYSCTNKYCDWTISKPKPRPKQR